MSGHQGGDTSSLSRALDNVQRQLKSGKTRKGTDLDKIPRKREQLEEEKAAILAKMQEAKDKRHDERMNAINSHTTEVGKQTTRDVNSHTTAQANRVIDVVKSLVPVHMRANPTQTEMAPRMASPAVTPGVLNVILEDRGIITSGTKAEKAAILAEKVPVHRLLALQAEHAGLAKAKPKAKSKAKAKAKAKAKPSSRAEKSEPCQKRPRASQDDGDVYTSVSHVPSLSCAEILIPPLVSDSDSD